MLRQEYPRPQFVRKDWLNLNGTWQFAFDDEKQGYQKKWMDRDTSLDKSIEVPFAYQSELSGIHDESAHDVVWYKRRFDLKKNGWGKRFCFILGQLIIAVKCMSMNGWLERMKMVMYPFVLISHDLLQKKTMSFVCV